MPRTVAAAIAISLLAASVSAHAAKEATNPPDGAVLADAPRTVEMRFDAPMRITMVRLTDAAGVERGLSRDDGMAPVATFVARPEALGAGTYTVRWRGLAADGHPMEGAFGFTVR